MISEGWGIEPSALDSSLVEEMTLQPYYKLIPLENGKYFHWKKKNDLNKRIQPTI